MFGVGEQLEARSESLKSRPVRWAQSGAGLFCSFE